MLRSLLTDGAIAAAKGYSHRLVEPRHVLFAAARHFRNREEVAPLLAVAKSALEPRGAWDAPPGMTPEAAALVDTFASEREAIAGLLAAFQPEGHPETRRPVPGQVESGLEPAPRAAPTGVPNQDGRREATSAVLAELDSLIGLASVKNQLKRVIAVVQANGERIRAGLPAVNPGLHLVFTGPPGTGKTTVARLVARLYASTGALPGANFIEASRSDLVAGFVGQTAIKTTELIERTRPGVLFIDEAYSLAPSHNTDFGSEAIASLVKAMEDHRHDFVLIAAGYGNEMSTLIDSNPGLRSRFKTYIDFPNYTPEELTRIFDAFATTSAVGLQNGVLARAEAIFRRVVDKPGFGNARFARSLFEEAYARMSARAAADGEVHLDELTAITLEDVDWQSDDLQRHIRRIGFGSDIGTSGGAAAE